MSLSRQICRLLYIYSRCLLSPNIWIFAACIVWSYTLGIWQLASQHHHILHHTAVICYDLFVLLRYEMLHSLPIYHHCEWLHRLFYLMPLHDSTRVPVRNHRGLAFGRWYILQVLTSHDLHLVVMTCCCLRCFSSTKSDTMMPSAMHLSWILFCFQIILFNTLQNDCINGITFTFFFP